MNDLVISIPTWGDAYRELTLRHTIPSVLAAIERGRRTRGRRVSFIVHTDRPQDFARPLRDFDALFCRVPRYGNQYHGLSDCHREAIHATPPGAALMLLNADIVASQESIEFAEQQFAGGRRAIVSVAMRCRSDARDVPIGLSASPALEWFWRNRHPIATDCLWGTGATTLPTNLFFEDGPNVVLHCFHLYPIVFVKDRSLAFGVTIDDDLLKNFHFSECAFATDRQCAFLELSQANKEFKSGAPLSVAGILAMGRSFSPRHIELFRRQIRIKGADPVPFAEPIVSDIATGYLSLWNRRRIQRIKRA